ncbi:hypothetical protein Bca101_029134 [Brassica carinata]
MALRATQSTARMAATLRRVARPFSTDAVVIIYSPARTATQQGSGKLGKWKINFLSTLKSQTFFLPSISFVISYESNDMFVRWENPLMGWTSTGDPYANVGDSALSFDSEDAAKSFADRHGWDYTVKKPKTPLLKPKSYSDNFKWKGNPQPEK